MITTTFYHDDYYDTFDARQAQKLSRKWTDSSHVKAIFDILDDERASIPLSDQDRDKTACTVNEVYEQNGVGYFNPNLDGKFEGTLWSSPINTRGWDARYCEAGSNECAKIGDLPDIPGCMTDYADTIFIIDNPAYIDLIIMVGEFTLSEPVDDGRVFLALHPDFVESHADIARIAEAARTEGNLFDIRDWKKSGKLAERTIKKGPFVARHAYWTGSLPKEIAEAQIIARLMTTAQSATGNIIKSYNIYYDIDLSLIGAVNLANALMMQRDLFDIDSFSVDAESDPNQLDEEDLFGYLIDWGFKDTSGNDDKPHYVNKNFSEFMNRNNFHFDDNAPCADAMIQQLAENVRKFADVTRIWNSMYKNRRVAVHFAQSEIEENKIFSRIFELGQFLGMDDYIDTVDSGVPVEDILA